MDEFYEAPQTVDLHTVLSLQAIEVREGVTLRPLDESDATRILEILTADDSIRDRVSVASRMYTPEHVASEVDIMRADPHLIRYAITENDRPVGLVSFWRNVDNDAFDAPDNPDEYGFGYFLDPAERGKGLITSSVQSIMDVAAMNLRVDGFIAYCEDNNPDSVAVLAKLGFMPTEETFVEAKNGWIERKFSRPAKLEQVVPDTSHELV